MCSSFRFSSAFSFCNASTDWVRGWMSFATFAAVYVVFLSAAVMNSLPETDLSSYGNIQKTGGISPADIFHNMAQCSNIHRILSAVDQLP